MSATTLPDRVNLAQITQITQIAWTERAAVANWRRRHDDFPSPVGGADAGPLFERPAAEEWLRPHHRLPDFTTPTPAERAGAASPVSNSSAH